MVAVLGGASIFINLSKTCIFITNSVCLLRCNLLIIDILMWSYYYMVKLTLFV